MERQTGRHTVVRVGPVAIVRPIVALERPSLVGESDEILGLDPAPVDIVRPADLLVLRFDFVNLRYEVGDDGAVYLRRRAARRPARLIATFPSQHIVERAYFEPATQDPNSGLKLKDPPQLATGGNGAQPTEPDKNKTSPETPEKPPIFASASGSSRLVFRVTTQRIAYSTPGLLDAMRTLDLDVAQQALPENEAPFLDLGWQGALDAGVIAVAKALARGTPAAKAAEFFTVSRFAATSARLEYRFGNEHALRTVGATRLGGRIGADRVIREIDRAGRRVFRQPPALPSAPGALDTAIELPWRLVISPNGYAAWAHSSEPVEHGGRTELWHTRLGVRRDEDGVRGVNEEQAEHRTIRAIWARDFSVLKQNLGAEPPDPNGPFPSATGQNDDPGGRLSLNSRDRMMLVHETANFHLRRGRRIWAPLAVPTNRLMLSALGGWLDSGVEFDTLPDGDLTIQEWKHRAGMGRDHYVKVVYAGFLMPFGHRASLVKITERKIKQPGQPAYLFQRMFIIVREHFKEFGYNAKAFSDLSRPELVMPFASVQIHTNNTPDLDPPEPHNLPPGPAGPGGLIFVPYVANAPFAFKLSAVDRDGHYVEFKAPLVFMERDHNKNDTAVKSAVAAYKSAADGEKRMPLRGQRVAFAASHRADDTVLSTESLLFEAKVHPNLGAIAQDDARFLPALETAKAVVPAMSALAGKADAVELKYPTAYQQNGYAGNKAEVFLELVAKSALDFSSQGDRSGGLVTPSIQVAGLSRLTGPIGGTIGDAVSGQFDPSKFFDGISAKLFGVVALKDLIKAIPFDPNRVPKFVSQTLNEASSLIANAARLQEAATSAALTNVSGATALKTAVTALTTALGELPSNPAANIDAPLLALAAALDQFKPAVEGLTSLPRAEREQVVALATRVRGELNNAAKVAAFIRAMARGELVPEVVTARLDWSTEIPAWPASKPILQPKGGTGRLVLAVDVQAPTNGAPPSVLVSCSITPFQLNLVAPVTTFMELHFETFEFSVAPGKKPDVNVKLRDQEAIKFVGALEFVDTLRKLVPFDGFSDPPYLDITSKGVKAGFDLAIPNLAIGVMSLENISLGAHLSVPFIDESLEVGFNFCTRENPFRLTVMLFGGGGFFGLQLTPKGVHVLEAAFEFGAALSMNFGVASGGVSVMAGIYFKLAIDQTTNKENATLAGYFRVRGEVDVLGLISASIELYLELSYETATQKAVGRASLTIEVEVLFLSFSVSISCEKKFAGANNDPTFKEQMGVAIGSGPNAPRPWDEYCRKFAKE